MATWSEVEAEAPELAARAKAFLDAHTHLTLATLRRDGSPRISGIEIVWRDSDLYIGSMWSAVKAQDLIRDPRFALHSGSEDPDDGWQGDAKVAGRAEELSEDEIRKAFPEVESRMHSFRLNVEELVVVGLDEPREHMVIESWHPGRGSPRRSASASRTLPGPRNAKGRRRKRRPSPYVPCQSRAQARGGSLSPAGRAP